MKIIRIIAMLLLVVGIALTGLSAYGYFYSEDKSHALQLESEQAKLLAEAFRAKGTPRERELMKEYEEGKGVTELARQHARQTSQTIMLAAGGGLVLMAVSLIILSRKRTGTLPA
jgi:Tfp pilus assembly protein PilV